MTLQNHQIHHIVKKIKNKFVQLYKIGVQNIEDFLDKEIDYLDSFSRYLIKKDLKKVPMNFKTFSFNEEKIISLDNLSGKSVKEVIKITKNFNEKTWGVVLESSKIIDLNLYIAQMNRVQINSRKSNFFIVTDCPEVLYKLSNIFNWMNKDFYITPNCYNQSISDEDRLSINYHCLLELDKIITTPNNALSNHLKNDVGKDVMTPNPKKVYSFKCNPYLNI